MAQPADSRQIKDDIKKAYDDIAGVYLDWTRPSHETRLSYLNPILRSLDASNGERQLNVLELGCGAGVPCTQLLASHEYINVTANDLSEVQIALAKERLPLSVSLIQGDMMGLEFNQEHFDVVLAMYSIIHLPRGEQTIILRRIYDWLNHGGRFVANFSEGGFANASNNSWLGGTKGAMHWSGWGRDEMRRILKDIGFIIETDEVVVDSEEDKGFSRSVPFHWVIARK